MKTYSSYFDYEYDLGEHVVSNSLAEFNIDVDGKSVLDIGCGEGGVLAGLGANYTFSALGVDYDQEMINRAKPLDNVTLKCADFLEMDFDESYDLLLLRDVLEHCGDVSQFLQKTASLMHESSAVYITYTPFYSPFGGHQHNGSGIFSNVPYIQVLPAGAFNKLIAPKGNLYKEQKDLIKDFDEIRRTCLTTNSVLQQCRQFGLHVSQSRAFIIRPDYKFKFGLSPLKLPAFVTPSSFTDPLCTSVEMILTKNKQAS